MARAWSSFRVLMIGKLNFFSWVYLITSFSSYQFYHLSFFEIYPRSEKPLLTQIARFSSKGQPMHLFPDTVICRDFHDNRTVFSVVDFRTNYSTCFAADVTLMYDVQVPFIISNTLISF